MSVQLWEGCFKVGVNFLEFLPLARKEMWWSSLISPLGPQTTCREWRTARSTDPWSLSIRNLPHQLCTATCWLSLRKRKIIYLDSVTVILTFCYLKTENALQLEKPFLGEAILRLLFNYSNEVKNNYLRYCPLPH